MKADELLLMTLRYFATGTMQLVVGDAIGMSQTAVSSNIERVCDAILTLQKTAIHMPRSAEECLRVAGEFYQIANLPNIVGTIDCTHIRMQSLGGRQAELFRNRKGYFSLNVQTISDKNLKIRDIVARWPGSSHDQTIFASSAIRQRFDRGDFGPYVLIGDSGYTNTAFLATPFTAAAENNELRDAVARHYNQLLISTRNTVERQYGVWKRRFPILAYGIRLRNIQTIHIYIRSSFHVQFCIISVSTEISQNIQ